MRSKKKKKQRRKVKKELEALNRPTTQSPMTSQGAQRLQSLKNEKEIKMMTRQRKKARAKRKRNNESENHSTNDLYFV